MLKDIFGSLGFVIVGSDILFWAYFFIMDKVSVFESSDFGELRIIVDPKGDVWFVASDVAKSLGYINAKDAVKRHVDDDDSMLLQVSDNQWGVKRSILKTRYIDSIRIINESGLYSLILSSKLESAKRFKKWITSEVLPSIRKTGEYKTSSGGKGILVPDFSNPADAARAWADQYEAAQRAIAEKSQAEAEKQQALKTIEDQRPDVEFAESFKKVDNDRMWLIRDIAKKLEQNGVIIAEKNLRSFLEEAKFMFRNGLGKWELYSNVVVKGYGVYRSYFIDKYSGDRINQQTIYMTGAGYEVTLNGIKGKLKNVFLKYVDILPRLKAMGFLDTNVWNPGISTAGITHTLQFGNALPKNVFRC